MVEVCRSTPASLAPALGVEAVRVTADGTHVELRENDAGRLAARR